MASANAGTTRRDIAEDEIVLGVLDVVERNPSATQRSIATELGIALGLANAYLRRCARKGLIKISEIPSRRYAYYLTPQGFSEKSRLTAQYLSHSFSFFRKAREQCGEVFAAAVARGHRRIALIGAGDLAEVASLVAREHDVEIVGVFDHPSAVAGRSDLGDGALIACDAIVVTSMAEAQSAFDAAVEHIGPDRVYAPDLLRLRPTTTGKGRA